jgi:hypothetical protein
MGSHQAICDKDHANLHGFRKFAKRFEIFQAKNRNTCRKIVYSLNKKTTIYPPGQLIPKNSQMNYLQSLHLRTHLLAAFTLNSQNRSRQICRLFRRNPTDPDVGRFQHLLGTLSIGFGESLVGASPSLAM